MIVVRRGATLSVVIEKVLISRVLFILLPVASRTMGYCPDWDTTLDILRGIFIDPDTRRLPGYQITGSQVNRHVVYVVTESAPFWFKAEENYWDVL